MQSLDSFHGCISTLKTVQSNLVIQRERSIAFTPLSKSENWDQRSSCSGRVNHNSADVCLPPYFFFCKNSSHRTPNSHNDKWTGDQYRPSASHLYCYECDTLYGTQKPLMNNKPRLIYPWSSRAGVFPTAVCSAMTWMSELNVSYNVVMWKRNLGELFARSSQDAHIF